MSPTNDYDMPLMTEVLDGAAICIDCIARRTGLEIDQAVDVLQTLANTLTITTHAGRCAACLNQAVVQRLD